MNDLNPNPIIYLNDFISGYNKLHRLETYPSTVDDDSPRSRFTYSLKDKNMEYADDEHYAVYLFFKTLDCMAGEKFEEIIQLLSEAGEESD